MPVKYNSREALIKVHLNEKFKSGYGSRETKVDSVYVIAHEKGAIRNQPLEIYYCKYKKQRSKQWLGVIIAFDDSNPEKLWPRFIQSAQTIVLDADEDEMEELRKEYLILEEENRRRINFNDGSSKFDFSWY